MIEISGQITEKNLAPVVVATRPKWSRWLEIGVVLILAAIFYTMGMAFWSLINAALGTAESYNQTTPEIRNEVMEKLLNSWSFLLGGAIVVLVGIPVFIYIGYRIVSLLRAIFVDSNAQFTRDLLKRIEKRNGLTFVATVFEDRVEVLSEKAASEQFNWKDFKSVVWGADFGVFKFKARRNLFFLLLDGAEEHQRQEIKAIVNRSGIPASAAEM